MSLQQLHACTSSPHYLKPCPIYLFCPVLSCLLILAQFGSSSSSSSSGRAAATEVPHKEAAIAAAERLKILAQDKGSMDDISIVVNVYEWM